MNSYGEAFRVTIFGESHGPLVGVCIDGAAPGMPLTASDFAADIDRRRPRGTGATERREEDLPDIATGLFDGHTTGAPLTLLFRNADTRPADYALAPGVFRPGHADFTAARKFGGHNDPRGGGHFSGRLTLALVAAGVVAKRMLPGLDFRSRVVSAGGRTDIEQSVAQAMAQGDSVGGVVECAVAGIPAGWGEPFFDTVEGCVARLAFAIPGVKGVEFGAGFAAAAMLGSQNNDLFVDTQGHTATNHSGGALGGITNGNPLVFRMAVKPTPSIRRPQATLDFATGQPATLAVGGRHDHCIALRVPVVAEAIAAIALADLSLRARKWHP